MTIRMWRPSLVSLLIISTQINQKLRSDFTGKSPTIFIHWSLIDSYCLFHFVRTFALDVLLITKLRFSCNAMLYRDTHLTNHNKVLQLPNHNSTRSKNMHTASMPSSGKRTPVAKRGKTYACCQARENVLLLPCALKRMTATEHGKTYDRYQAREKCVTD